MFRVADGIRRGRHRLDDSYTGIYYYAIDLNGNTSADANEILFGLGNAGLLRLRSAEPDETREPVNKIGNYTTPRAQEFMFGMDHELMPNFGVSATFTYRYYDHFNWRSGSLIGVSAADYTQTGTLSGSTKWLARSTCPSMR
jgi:hypothetical protein